MAQKFMKTQEVADFLGLTPADVNNLRETHQLHAYRDGADWKFKADEVEQYARDRQSGETGRKKRKTPTLCSASLSWGNSAQCVGHGDWTARPEHAERKRHSIGR